MKRYSLKMADIVLGVDRVMEFSAVDSGQAVDVLSLVQHGRRAELWEDDFHLFTLIKDRDDSGLWSIDR